ncbi:MAG: N-acetylmuramoyl-L-alanine amidase family protein [Polyangiaceae bacterium]
MVIDLGHGGKDTGAVGPSGVREKDVTLDIARRVAGILGGHGSRVLLTRDDDRFVSLEERTARANGFAADLFVSIHCNASETKTRRGVETYVLDTTRDEIAAKVAARESATTLASTAELASILGDMRVADQEQRSIRFARLLERSAFSALQTKYGDAVNGGVHTAGFYVLVGATMPSVLFRDELHLERSRRAEARERGRPATPRRLDRQCSEGVPGGEVRVSSLLPRVNFPFSIPSTIARAKSSYERRMLKIPRLRSSPDLRKPQRERTCRTCRT